MKVSVYVGMSLDGFIAASDGSLDWLTEIRPPDGDDFGFSRFMESVDAVVMGRVTFDFVVASGQWPYEIPVFVLSEKMTAVPDYLSEKAFIMRGNPGEVVGEMNERGLRRLYIDGGQVVRQFLNAGMVDEMVLARVPIILGDGVRLFSNLQGMSRWQHEETEVLVGQIVKSRYTIRR